MLIDKIFNIVQTKHRLTGGHSGVYIKQVQIELMITTDEIEQIIEDLHNQDKIKLCSGIHGLMIKLK